MSTPLAGPLTPPGLGAAARSGLGRCAGEVCDVEVTDGATNAPRGYRSATSVGREVAQLIRAGRMHPDVRAFAAAVAPPHTAGAPPPRAETARRLLQAVWEHVRYVPDPHRAELVQSAPALLRSRAGDCEDMTGLMGAALESVGVPVRVVLAGFDPAGGPQAFDHVFVEVEIAAGVWIDADPTLAGPPALGRVQSETRPLRRLALPVYPDAKTYPSPVAVSGPPPAMALGAIFPFPTGPGAGGFGSQPGGFGSTPGGFGSQPGGFGSSFGRNLFSGSGSNPSPITNWDRGLEYIAALTPLILALVGTKGGAQLATPGSQAPPGTVPVTDPQTGRTYYVDEAIVREASRQAGMGGSGTLWMLAAAAGLAGYFLMRKR